MEYISIRNGCGELLTYLFRANTGEWRRSKDQFNKAFQFLVEHVVSIDEQSYLIM
jgi:hypothetical protein